MAIGFSSPVTGTAQSGLTSPTYTPTADVPPVPHSKQWGITGLGGTQSGVLTHGTSTPFTCTVFRPKTFYAPASADPSTGLIYGPVKMNQWTYLTRKGVLPLSNNPRKVMEIRTTIKCPAGAEQNDAANVRAGLSCHFGWLASESDNIGLACVNGLL